MNFDSKAVRFADRKDGGKRLGKILLEETFHNRIPTRTIVLALPRGGVPVGYEVALILNAPLDVFLVRKIGVPWHQELAVGAIASGGIMVIDHQAAESLGVTADQIQTVVDREREELHRRTIAFRNSEKEPILGDHTVILVDDGLATGSTMRAAAEAIRRQNPERLIVAVPVAPLEVCNAFREIADEVVCATTPSQFEAVGKWYTDFAQTSDEEVKSLLADAKVKLSRAA